MGVRGRWRRLVDALVEAGGEASFSELAGRVGWPLSSVEYALGALCRLGLVRRVGRGRYRLARFTPLMFGNRGWWGRAAYFGLLGLRMERREPEYAVAVRALEGEGFRFSRLVVATTAAALGSWGDDAAGGVEWVVVREEEAFDPGLAARALRPRLEELARDYPVVADVTSGPRPAALALFAVCRELRVPVVYVREGTGEVVWVVRPEEAVRAFWLEELGYSEHGD